MSFSRLLLEAANSQKCIRGKGEDKVRISAKVTTPGRDAYEGEVVLCFQLDDPSDDEKRVSKCIAISDDNKRCDGLVFYTQDGRANRVVCLVEMKGTNVTNAKDQLIKTKEHLEKLLRDECDAMPEEYRSRCKKQIGNITWKACIFHHGASSGKIEAILSELKTHGFNDVSHLTNAQNDLRPLLTGEGRSAREMANKLRNKKKR